MSRLKAYALTSVVTVLVSFVVFSSRSSNAIYGYDASGWGYVGNYGAVLQSQHEWNEWWNCGGSTKCTYLHYAYLNFEIYNASLSYGAWQATSWLWRHYL